jgi:5'-3' exonuclease
MPDALITQIPLIEEMIRLMNIEIVEISGFEADDII